jgi:hypothetical protein
MTGRSPDKSTKLRYDVTSIEQIARETTMSVLFRGGCRCDAGTQRGGGRQAVASYERAISGCAARAAVGRCSARSRAMAGSRGPTNAREFQQGP